MSEEIKDKNEEAETFSAIGEDDAALSDADEFESEAEEVDEEVVIYDADAEDALEAMRTRAARDGVEAPATDTPEDDDTATPGVRSMTELMSIVEALIFVAEEPLTTKAIADV